MSSSAIKWVRRQSIPDGSLKSVLMELASVSRDGVNAWPSQATIAASTGLSRRTVWQSLRVLQNLGLIRRQRRSRGRLGRTSDMVSLSVHREFSLTRADILVARAATVGRVRQQIPNVLQLANFAPATRNRCEGIKRDKHLPIQGEKSPSHQGVALGSGRPSLTLVVGTAKDGENAA